MLPNSCKHEELKGLHPAVDMTLRQTPLQNNYKTEPENAWITDRASTSSERIGPTQPLYGEVTLDGGRPTDLTFGVHKAVGGEGDYPVPGELLCAAVATCLDSTIRIIANRMHIELGSLHVQVEAQVDVRGTLLVERQVPVGFQTINVEVRLDTLQDVESRKVDMLLRAAEHSCIVIQTLRNGAQIAIERVSA